MAAPPTTFEPVICLSDPTTMPSRFSANKGALEVHERALAFEGKQPLSVSEPLSVGRVHSGQWAQDLIRVDFAVGENISSVYFVVAKRGKVGRDATDRLNALLTAMVEKGGADAKTSPGRAQAVEGHRQALAEQARARDTGRRITMILGAILLVGGVIVTVASYAAASDTGGTYVFAYGAIIVGLLLIVRGLAQRTRERGR